MSRKTLLIGLRKLILHEGGYKCANPICRTILTLDVHHLTPISKEGQDEPENLLALCPNCHALHHKGEIPSESLRAWKMFLLALNEAFDQRSIDLLLALGSLGTHFVSGDGVLKCAALVAAGLVKVDTYKIGNTPIPAYSVELNEKGKRLVAGWKEGKQNDALGLAT